MAQTRVMVLMLAVLVAVTLGVAALAIAARKDDRAERKGSHTYPPAIDRLEPGAKTDRVRRLLGRPDSQRSGPSAGQRCWLYRDLPASRTSYELCFQGGRLVSRSPI
jgi:hypothetical protein